MNNHYEYRRTTLHAPTVVIVRDRARLMHGEPRCGRAPFPGSTTSVQVLVTCEKCKALLEEK